MSLIHCDIPRGFNALVEEKFLYNMDETKKDWLPCEVFAVSSYKGHALTFKIRIKSNGALFDYIPAHGLRMDYKSQASDELLKTTKFEHSDLVFGKNCPSNLIAVNKHELLKRKCFHVYMKQKNTWIKGFYICTVDWYTSNENAHILGLENGQIAAVPNHKCLALLVAEKEPKELPEYKKLRGNWIV